MKRILPFILLLIAFSSKAQIISQFTWDTNPVTKAAVGPNALSSSAKATSSTGGLNGTNGLNPGTPSTNVDLTLNGSYYNVPGLEISFNFKREESEASFFRRGSNFDFGMSGGNLYANFKLTSGASTITVNSGNVYSIPNDHAFHSYKFKYDYATGVANIMVDGAIVYTYAGVAGRPQNWTSAGNPVIGANMDATGRNIAVLDNFIIQNSANPVALPMTLLSFDAITKKNIVQLSWTTTREFNVASIEVERSVDGSNFSKIQKQSAVGGYNVTNAYSFNDMSPVAGTNYYRLKMIDNDGKFTYSEVRKVQFSVISAAQVFPNPAVSYVMISLTSIEKANYTCSIYSIDGALLKSMNLSVNAGVQNSKVDLSQMNYKGIIMIQLKDENGNSAGSFRIIKK